jgi:hypothetical protein
MRIGKQIWLPSCLAAFICGCNAAGRLVLDQPALSRSERRMVLETGSADFDVSPDGVARYLLAFPLPGARYGRHYLIYFRVPSDHERHQIGQPLPDGGITAGFLIQTRGQHKGLTEFVSGTVETSGVFAAGDSRRRGRLRLRCADGSTLEGDFTAKRDRLTLRDFEQHERPGDLQALTNMRGREASQGLPPR